MSIAARKQNQNTDFRWEDFAVPNERPAYIRFLNLLRAIRELSPLSSLTADECVMLDELVLKWHDQTSVRMSDLLNDEIQASRTTAHRRLVALRDKGLVIFDDDPYDKRAKFIRPGAKANFYMQLVEEGIDQLLIDGCDKKQ